MQITASFKSWIHIFSQEDTVFREHESWITDQYTDTPDNITTFSLWLFLRIWDIIEDLFIV